MIKNMLKNSIQQKTFRKIKNLKCCEICGTKEDRLVRHHPNYNEPFNVMILCDKCHYKWHKNNKAIERKDYKLNFPNGRGKIILDIELVIDKEIAIGYGGYLGKNKIKRDKDLQNYIKSKALSNL